MSVALSTGAAFEKEAVSTPPRARPPQRLVHRICKGLILPAMLVAVWETGVRVGLIEARLMPPPSQIAHVFAALAKTSEGLGYLLVDGQQLGKPDEILVALITFAIIGQACDTLLVLATRPLVGWQDTDRRPF